MRSIETAGQAAIVGGVLNVGGVEIPVGQDVDHVWVYVRRWPHDLTVSEVLIAFHNGPAAELLDNQNAEAARFPLGEKEYWRGEMVGLYSWGDDDHLMTDEDYEKYWMEFEQMARREYGDEDDMDAGDLRSMKQVYGALMRQGASTEDLAGAYDELGKVDSYSYEPTIL